MTSRLTIFERLIRALDRDNALSFAVLQYLGKRNLVGPWVEAPISLSDSPRWARHYPNTTTAAVVETAHGLWSAEICGTSNTRASTFSTMTDAMVWADQHFRARGCNLVG